MIWKNPFLIRQAEKIDTAANFLQLFSSDALSFVSEQSFNTIQFIRSSPGAGKTTVFKAMQPNVLNLLDGENENTKDFYNLAVKNKLIESDDVKLLSCIISCVKNYADIDEMFRNGRRQQILFALLNVRIVVLMLKSIMSIKDLKERNSLRYVTFIEYPEDCLAIQDQIYDGYSLYCWAQVEERKICQYLDALSDEPANLSLNYSTLFFIKLFEPHNILFHGKVFVNHSLIIFDDVQELTKHQRGLLTTTLFTTRPNLGIWVGERLAALSDSEIIRSNATIGREYESINLEEYWKDRGKIVYKNTLSGIADRRARMYSDGIAFFDNCLENKIEYKKYSGILLTIVNLIIAQLNNDDSFGCKYLKIVEYIHSKYSSLYDRALALMVIDISYKRDISNGQMSLLQSELSIPDYEVLYKDNVSVAAYYLSIKAKLPYYFGCEKLKEISSYNIEQFLAFTGAIFEQYAANDVLNSKQKSNIKIKPEEQERCIKQVAKQRYDEILSRFEYGENIQNLLKSLSYRSLQTRDRGTNPYAGGAATGVAISISSLAMLEEERYCKLSKILSDCISSNYFDKRYIVHSGQEWMVLYYNRWICVYYDLPLSYGGWFRATIQDLESFTQSPDRKNSKSNTSKKCASTTEGIL